MLPWLPCGPLRTGAELAGSSGICATGIVHRDYRDYAGLLPEGSARELLPQFYARYEAGRTLTVGQEQHHASECADNDNQQRRRAPDREENKSDKCDGEVAGRVHRTGPNRTIERRSEQAYDSGVDPPHRCLGTLTSAKCVPER